MAHYVNPPGYRGGGPSRSVVDTRKGWTIAKDHDSGLMFLFRPDGTKYGQTQTVEAARILRSRAIVNAIPMPNLGGIQ